ncbi:uncharacterized protein A4U43_C06F1550 [Asparagus officinalis]|uniref:Uncharacterized protein n=1 Tax=Asparagus officinalis TaxID=4686 RepID=A0A5P1EJ90_ASPOF|nr:uncharacterized protein A4U43_C06F1550 [Asparagus officinalis]
MADEGAHVLDAWRALRGGWQDQATRDRQAVHQVQRQRRVEEGKEMEEVDRAKHLVYDRVLGPDLAFSPLVYLQFTRFKCGGLAIGLSWAHVLGDAVSASNSLNLWTHILNTNQPPTKIQHQKETDNKITLPITENPRSLKKVEPVGDFWLPSTSLKMATFSFKISKSKVGHLQSKMSGHVQAFEAISAVVWQSLAILRNDTSEERKYVLGNKQIISTVSIDSSVAKLELSELAMLMRNSDKDEKKSIAEIVDKGDGKEDFIIYGANLTFADMQGVDLYGLELKGQKPAYVDYSIHGVGEEGAILVLPAPDESGTGGRALTVILPEDEILKLKEVLASEWSIA